MNMKLYIFVVMELLSIFMALTENSFLISLFKYNILLAGFSTIMFLIYYVERSIEETKKPKKSKPITINLKRK